jgi:uncharacterized protein YggU (UPF0235/DUF167 family)
MAAWRLVSGGAELRVKASPGARDDRIEDVALDASGESHLKVHIRAAPEKGRANAAIEALLAEALGVPKSAVSVEKGAAGRAKVVRIAADASIAAALAKLAGEADGG